MLIQKSASFSTAESSRATPLGTATSLDVNYSPSDLNITVTALPSHGAVTLADGFTPVSLGQTVTLAQLAALKFRPASNCDADSSGFGSGMSGPAAADVATGAELPASCSALSVPQNDNAQAIGIRLPTDTNYPASESCVRITELPTNGTVLLSDGTTAITQEQTLTGAQLTGLMFKPAADACGQISILNYRVSGPAGHAVAGYVLLIVGPATPPLSAPASSPPASGINVTSGIVASVGIAALLDMTLSSAMSSELTPSTLPADEKDQNETKNALPSDGDAQDSGKQDLTVAQFNPPSPNVAEQAPRSEPGITEITSTDMTVNEETAARIGSSGLPLAIALPSSTALQDAGATLAQITPASVAPINTASASVSTTSTAVITASPIAQQVATHSTSEAPLSVNPVTPLDSGLTTQPLITTTRGSPPATSSTGPTIPAPQSVQTPTAIEGGTNTGAPSPLSDIDVWSAQWRAAATTTPCGSCAGGSCTICSIRIGGPSATNGMPTGYVPRTVMYYDPSTTVGGSNPNAPSAELSAGSSPTALAAAAATNAIVLENMKPGSPQSEWLIDQGDSTIEGYAAQFSINHGQRVDFKIDTDSRNYRIDIYRIGYYGGDGARKVATINRNLATAQVQPVPIFDPTRRLVDAGNWSVSASWDIPADAVSGVYIAKLTRLDGSGGANMIPFIVRDDENPSDITFQTSDTTWQAYNWWGGYNLYGGITQAGREGRASAVSYNRPIITRDGGYSSGPQDFIFSVEYPTIRWLEQNGYDINYITGIDTARSGAQLLNSKVFLSVGHDEYWSADQRANVEAARDSGVNLAFLSGNEIYWQTRWESSIDGNGTPYKTLVSYKERWANSDVDTNGTTSTWRDPQFGSGRPENSLTGTIFTVDSYRLDTITIPYNLSNFRFWNNTAVGNIQPGQVYSLVPNLLGYEWDSDLDNGARPAGLIALSSSTVDVEQLLLDYGNTTGPGTATHSLTLYRAPSGALVFGAGTVYWSWGLDSNHDLEETPTDPNVQQAMVNLFADMGVQPATLMASLAAASQTTDRTSPTTSITSPTASGSYTAAQPIVISGTAVDAGGGLVAVVEVSTDGGTTWHRATGFENWTYTWVPLAGGTYNIRSRAVDDSVNLETPGAGRTITVAPAPVWSLLPQSVTPAILSDTDVGFVNLGVRFSSSQAGTIAGIKFYKGIGDGGAHVGSLWSSTGTLLASATFTGETASGWQTVTFSNPVSITAGTTYVASYRSSGHYANTDNYFTGPLTNGPLTAQAGNGYFTYSANNAFPTTASNGVNYFVDVIFTTVNTPNQPPVAVNDSGFTVTRDTPTTFAASLLLANDTDPNGDILILTGAGAASGGTVSFNSQTSTITFTPNAGYTGPASFGYSISDGRGGTGSAFVNLTVAPPSNNVSLFSPSDTPANLTDTDAVQINLGVRFVSSTAGTITGIRYYKGANDTGTHTGSLWTSTGTLLATATFTNETASGWQQVNFATPVSITAGTTYVASYHSNGRYTSTGNYFTTNRVNGPLTAPASNNGVYTYGNGNLFPSSTFGATNYWVDVVFSTSGATNQPPVAINDSGFTTAQNTTLTIAAAALLANDSDPNSDPLTITGVSGAVNGTVSFNAQTNVISFTPTTGYTGAAAFSYTVSDGQGGTASATVGLTVNSPVNQPPVAVNDSGFSTAQNTTLTIAASALLANDTDPNADPLTITGVSGATNGTVSFNAQTNVITFVPTTGYTGAASFNYAISDGRTGTANATVSLTVTTPVTSVSLFSASDTPANLSDADTVQVNLGVRFVSSTAGTITGIRYYKGAGDTGTHIGSLWTSTGTLLATATFTNETASGWQQVNFATPVSITAGTTYVASYHSNGRYTSTGNYFTTDRVSGPLTAAAGNNGVYAYGNGNLFPSSTFGATNYWVDVVFSAPGAANQPPVAVNDSGFSTAQNTTLTIAASALLANDTDPNGDPLTITGVSGAVNGTVSFNAQTNVISFTPTTGYTGAASFSYTVSDGRSGTASATVGLTVSSPTNQPPVAVNDSGFTTAQNTTLAIAASALLANDTDPNGDPLTITGVSGATNGTVSFNAQTNVISFTPTTGYTGAASFSYSVSDGRNGTASATVGLTVSAPTNQPPVAVNDSGFSTAQNTTLTIAASALLTNDTDPNGDPLTITGVSGATNGTVSFNAQTNVISFTPTTGYTGTASFSYAISDGRNGTANATVGLTVTPPVSSVSLFSASDTPANLTDPDAVQINLGVRFVSSTSGTITGIRYYKGASDTGTHTGSLWTSTGTLLATATFTNETASGWQQVNFATPVSINAGTTYVASYHSNGHYTSTGNYFSTNRVSGPLTAPAGNNGVYTYGNGNLFPTSTFGATNYWVDVVFSASSAANQPPVAVNDSGFSTAQNTTLTIAASTLLANDTDPNGDSLTITGVSGAANGTVSFNAQTNTVSFTPTANYTGSASFNYSISDGNGGTASANAALSVTTTPTATTTSLFSASSTPSVVTVNDPAAVELGLKFQASSNGEITGIRFYKGPQNTGTHTANLWTSTGSLLATATFTNETSSGWQQVNFATPVSITSGTTYVASYHTNGNYSADPNYFATSRTNGPLTAPSSSSSGGNGVYAYGSSSLFPTSSFNSTSYGVDVLFRAQLAA